MFCKDTYNKICSGKMATTDTTFKEPSKEFTDYLNKHRVLSSEKNETNTIATHLSMSHPYGKFSIPQNEIETFMTHYQNEINKGSSLGIVEKPLSHMETPFVCDIDLKYELYRMSQLLKPVWGLQH